MMMITPIVFPPCIGDSRSLCRSFHMHHVRYRYGGDCEGVWRVEPVFLFRFRTSLDGRHEGRRDMRSAKGGKKRPEQVRETLVWVSVILFRPSVGWYRMFGYVRDAVSLACSCWKPSRPAKRVRPGRCRDRPAAYRPEYRPGPAVGVLDPWTDCPIHEWESCRSCGGWRWCSFDV